MNKNIFKYLALFILVASMAMGFIAASEMVEHDFDGNFTADVPKGINFESEYEDSRCTYFHDDSDLVIQYFEKDDLHDDNVNEYYEGFCGDGDFKVVKTDKNFTFLEGEGDYIGYSAVGVHTDGKVVIIMGPDADEIKAIAESVKWS